MHEAKVGLRQLSVGVHRMIERAMQLDVSKPHLKPSSHLRQSANLLNKQQLEGLGREGEIAASEIIATPRPRMCA